MRDYKNVKVPRSYRAPANRVVIRRVDTGPERRQRTRGTGSARDAALRVLLVLIIVSGCWLAWQGYEMLTHAERFQIAGVDVQGKKRLGDAELHGIVNLFKGQNVFRVDLDAAARLARANPWVKDVRIHRRLPNRISIVLTERVPYALLDQNNGLFLIDGEGFVISRLTREEREQWPLPALALGAERVRAGEHLTAGALDDAIELLAEIRQRGGWREGELTVRATTPETIAVVYAGHEFRLGTGRYAEKLRRLAEVMADVQDRGIEVAYVDLRPERQAAVMVKNDRSKGQGAGGKGKKKGRAA